LPINEDNSGAMQTAFCNRGIFRKRDARLIPTIKRTSIRKLPKPLLLQP